MTLNEIQKLPNGIRAVLAEQYEDVRTVLPAFTDFLLFCCEKDGNGKIQAITFFKNEKETPIDLGIFEIQKYQPAEGMSLNLDAIREDDVLPSFVMDDELISSISGSCYEIYFNDVQNPIEFTFVFDYGEDNAAKAPVIVVFLENTQQHKATQEDLFAAIGFIQHILTTAVASFLVEQYVKQINESQKHKQSRPRKKTVKQKKTNES